MRGKMDPASISQSPFAVLTFIAAPALLTNASSVLALSTTNRMLRTRDRMQELFAQSEKGGLSDEESAHLIETVSRVETQGMLLLAALHSIYISLGAFSAATLVTLFGAALGPSQGALWFTILAGVGLLLGFLGGGGLFLCSVNLFRATRISLVNIHDEAGRIRKRQAERREKPLAPSAPITG